MVTLNDVGAKLARVVDLAGRIREALGVAEDIAQDAQALLATHGTDTSDPEWEQAGGNFANGASNANALYRRLDGNEKPIESLQSSLGLPPETQPRGIFLLRLPHPLDYKQPVILVRAALNMWSSFAAPYYRVFGRVRARRPAEPSSHTMLRR